MLEKLKIKIPQGSMQNSIKAKDATTVLKPVSGQDRAHRSRRYERGAEGTCSEESHENQIYEAARRAGLVTLRESGLRKVFEGITTLEEILRVTLGEQE
jgi:hypothetical protein